MEQPRTESHQLQIPVAGSTEIADPLQSSTGVDGFRPRRRFVLDDTGFNEVPLKYRKFYRKWNGVGDRLTPNEVVCPVCKVVIRSSRELRPGDRVYCMPCMSRLTVVRAEDGTLEARAAY
jgi:hypothetical protein